VKSGLRTPTAGHYARHGPRLGRLPYLAILVLARNAAVLDPQEDPRAALQDPRARAAALADGNDDEPRWCDPEDGWFDLSRFLEEPHGFLPLVVPITEPALGYGAVAGAAFLDPRESAGAEGWARPNITFVGGLWTEGGSEGYFAANSSLWAGGALQTLVGGGDLALELELHGIGEDTVLEDDPVDYRLDVTGLVGEGRTRLGSSDFWVALRFAHFRRDARNSARAWRSSQG